MWVLSNKQLKVKSDKTGMEITELQYPPKFPTLLPPLFFLSLTVCIAVVHFLQKMCQYLYILINKCP